MGVALVAAATACGGSGDKAGGAGGGKAVVLTLERTVVAANSAAATGVTGVNLGGGIGNIQFFGPAPELTLTDSVVTANRLTASPGVASQGGGLFNLEVMSTDPFSTGNPFPVTLTRSVIAGNGPDQCAGC